MKFKSKTKIRYNSGANLTTVPQTIMQLMDGNPGDYMVWNFETKNDEPVLIVEIEKGTE